MKVRYLLDTNAWFRLVDSPEILPTNVLDRILKETTLGLSPFSLIEIAQKNAKRPLIQVDLDLWFDRALSCSRIQLHPITPEIARLAYDLGPDFHGDPADRIIAATAMHHQLTLVTSDRLLLEYRPLRTLSTR